MNAIYSRNWLLKDYKAKIKFYFIYLFIAYS